MSDSIQLSIFRYDPSVDDAAYYEDYDVPFQDDGETDFMSILQCLVYIQENISPVAFDSNCGAGWCGRCAMTINGIPRLACHTKAEVGVVYTVEPLKGFPVLRDLIVEKDPTYQKYVDAIVEVQRSTPMETLVNIDYDYFYNTLYKFTRCRECMCCYSVCPKVSQGLADRFIGPGAMMQVAMRDADPNDEADRVWQAAFSGVFECDLCGECAAVCPARIDIVGMISSLQSKAVERGLQNFGMFITPTATTVAEGMAETERKSVNEKLSSMPVEEIIADTCSQAGCHSGDDLLAYKTDLESATLRVNSHVSTQANISDEKKQDFVDFFAE